MDFPFPWGEHWLWVSGSLLLAAFSLNLAWFLHQSRSEAVAAFVARLTAWPLTPLVIQFLRLAYYLGIPFAALIWGHDVIVGRQMGFQPLILPALSTAEAGAIPLDAAANWSDWAHDVGWAAMLACGAWGALAVGWWNYRSALRTVSVDHPIIETPAGWVLLREAVYHEVHWAFYRNTPILAIGAYWGSWVGLTLIAVEAILNPAWHRWLMDPGQLSPQLARTALAVVSTVCFMLTQNLWLAVLLHWGVSWGLSALVRAYPVPPQPAVGHAG
jgi:hypothetical protein